MWLCREIDRVFKKVAEGVVTFDSIYDKVQQSNNQTQKEKLESDLKREIKKLQRFRDQIKTWLGGNEIKDKKPLMEQRRIIEVEMEKFKACEKEMKTKAYSKEGLINSTKLDPKEKEKVETSGFVSNMLEELEHQVEFLEAEQETLQASMKKGRKDLVKQERLNEIEESLERHEWHLGKLETILRMLENGTISPDVVKGIQDDIQYYVESNQDPEFAEDDMIYDDLNLDDELADELETSNTEQREETPSSLEELASSDSAQSATAPSSAQPTPPPVPVPTTSNNVNGSTSISISSTSTSTSTTVNNTATINPIQSPAPVSLNSKRTVSESVGSNPVSIAPSISLPSSPKPRSASMMVHAHKPASAPVIKKHLSRLSLPGGVDDLLDSLEAARKRILKPPQLDDISPLLETSFRFCPAPQVAERPKDYAPTTYFPTPKYYPQEQFVAGAEVFEKMDVDTLFYVFYYQQGTYQQFLAAKELKKRSWRFHKRFLTWFQRHEEPKVINNEYEQGTYRYFDFEGSWLQRRKTNFKFEYQFLEDDL